MINRCWNFLFLAFVLLLSSSSIAMNTPTTRFLNGYGNITIALKEGLQNTKFLIDKSKRLLRNIPHSLRKLIFRSKSASKIISTPRKYLNGILRNRDNLVRSISISSDTINVDEPNITKNTGTFEAIPPKSSFDDIPRDVLIDIIALTTPNGTINLSQASKNFRRLTKSIRSNLHGVRESCGNRIYYKLTLDGRYLFSSANRNENLHYLRKRGSMEWLKLHHLCIKALLLTNELVKTRLDSFTIWLSHEKIEESFLQALVKLLKIKSFNS